MTKWILILTIIKSVSYGGVSVESVPYFETKESCVKAAKAWKNDFKDNYDHTDTRLFAVCTER